MQERHRSVANATDTTVLPGRDWATDCAKTERLSPMGGLKKNGKTWLFEGDIRRNSVRKYQIVWSAQKRWVFHGNLRAKRRVRNLVQKSCKKELIPSNGCAIVSIILVKMKSLCARQDARTGRPFRRRGCGFRRIWRKWLGFVKNPIFSLAFFGRNGYTSVINNLLSGLRNNYYKWPALHRWKL